MEGGDTLRAGLVRQEREVRAERRGGDGRRREKTQGILSFPRSVLPSVLSRGFAGDLGEIPDGAPRSLRNPGRREWGGSPEPWDGVRESGLRVLSGGGRDPGRCGADSFRRRERDGGRDER